MAQGDKSAEIKVKVDKLTEELQTLKNAIGEFEKYSSDFINQCISDLGGQNADFIEAVKDTLTVMTDTKAPELVKKINEFHDNGVFLVETFKEVDTDIAKSEKIDK